MDIQCFNLKAGRSCFAIHIRTPLTNYFLFFFALLHCLNPVISLLISPSSRLKVSFVDTKTVTAKLETTD